MKRVTFYLFALIGILIPQITNAQVCKISGTNGDTVEVFSSSYSDGKIDISLSSDSQSAANVTVSVSVVYRYSSSKTETKTFTQKVLAQPSQSTPVSISVPQQIKVGNLTYEFDSYSVDSVTGVKCL